MLPVTHGIPFTRLHIVLYTILLVVATMLPVLPGEACRVVPSCATRM